MCVLPLLGLLFGFNIHKWNLGFTTCYSCNVIEKFIAIFVVLLKNSQRQRCHSLHLVCICEHFWSPSWRKTFRSIVCDNLAENSAWNLWKFTRKLWNCEAPSQKFFSQHFGQDMADHFALHCEHLFAHFWTFYTTVLQFLHSLEFVHTPCIIHNGFPQHSCF
jgi:hypothetical protein